MSAQPAVDEFAATARRFESFLHDRKPRLAASPPALVEAFSAAAQALGVTVAPGHEVHDGETAAAALERIAAAARLLARAVPLSAARPGETAVPIIAFAKADGEPVLINRRGRRWLMASRQTEWIFRPAPRIDLAAFEPTGYMILPTFPDTPIKVPQLLGFGVRRNAGDLAGFVLATLIAGMIAALLPLVSQPLFEIVVPEHDTRLLSEIALFLAIVVAVNLMTRCVAGLARVRLDGRTGFLLRAAAIDRALRIADRLAETGQPMPSAPIAALSTRSVESWYRGVWGLGLTLVTSLMVATPSLLVMAQASVKGAVVVTLVFFVAFGLAGWIARRRVDALLNGLTAPQSWMTTAYEALAMVDTVRAGAAEGRVFSRWADGFLSLRHRFLRADRIGTGAAALEAGFESMFVLSAMLALVLAGSVAAGATTVAFVVAAGNVTGAATAFLGALGEVTMLALQFRMIQPILHGELLPRAAHLPMPPLSGRIELAHVNCRLSRNGPLALEDISLAIAPGEHIGIAGPSGAGKSTLMRTMLGLIRPESGHVLFDGRDLAALDAAALRRQIGVIGQGGKLFPGTLLDNIAAGAPVTHDMAMEAARRAGFDAEIAALPLGLATPIGDAETGFSGGEVQRILLARTFATNPRILVLDEATSALDPQHQAHVAGVIAEMRATTITITHRLDTLRPCDRIYVLNGGRIVEVGTYAKLAAADGLFASMREAEKATSAHQVNAVHAAFGAVEAAFS